MQEMACSGETEVFEYDYDDLLEKDSGGKNSEPSPDLYGTNQQVLRL